MGTIAVVKAEIVIIADGQWKTRIRIIVMIGVQINDLAGIREALLDAAVCDMTPFCPRNLIQLSFSRKAIRYHIRRGYCFIE